MPSHLATELDIFENELALKKQGKIEDRVFAETRLRRGSYGQRYDNGQRHDGRTTRILEYPTAATKGPHTFWDAPGMQRIKIPFGGLNATQLEVLAESAEEYSDGVAHVTTRQDFQLHFVHIEDTPSLMRRLAAVGITTREACGNSIRNVTACPIAGVCRDQVFDVTPYAKATAYFLLTISRVSIYYGPESDLRVKSYDHLNFSRAFVFQFRASLYVMRLNRTSKLKVMTI